MKIKILYLYAELMSYNIAVIKELVTKCNAEVHIISWDKEKLTPYVPPQIEGVTYYKKSDFNINSAQDLIFKLQPDLVFTSGWMDPFYIKLCKQIRRKNIPVIAFSDTQWKGTIKQKIGRIYFRLFYKKAFSNILVSGAYQFEYAKKLGFNNNQIQLYFLTADLAVFNHFYNNTIKQKELKYPKNILFAGRFAPEKGLDILINAWQGIANKNGWKLTLVGNGILKNELVKHSDIEVLDFVQPENFESIIENSGCFVLPSRNEPWALVLHEFTAAGLPIICSDVCGAAPTFVISGYNGYTFESENIDDLKTKLEKIINKTEKELIEMAKRSHKIGQRIDPESIAYKFVSFLK